MILLISFVSNLISNKAYRTLRRKQIATLQHFCSARKDKSRFKAVTALTVQNLAPFGCFPEFVRIVHRAGQNIDLLFSRPKFAHLGPVYMEASQPGKRAGSLYRDLGSPYILCKKTH